MCFQLIFFKQKVHVSSSDGSEIRAFLGPTSNGECKGEFNGNEEVQRIPISKRFISIVNMIPAINFIYRALSIKILAFLMLRIQCEWIL